MHLYDPEEKEGQALFFSPEKIARMRDRVTDNEQAEEQRKQITSDKKLQKVITRDEKAREAEEKRIARDLARQTAREELAREKAERQAIQEAKKAQKATKAVKRTTTTTTTWPAYAIWRPQLWSWDGIFQKLGYWRDLWRNRSFGYWRCLQVASSSPRSRPRTNR
jgi:hypothetical protein